MSTGSLKIHSENIMPIIKKWLYSDKDIFLRELVSNACDALQKLQILCEKESLALGNQPLKIEIAVDKDAKTLTICDSGIGMDAQEVEKYIAQIAFSGAEEFLSKYTSNNEKDQIIGHFGLGFYSAYMVAKTVQIDSLSYKEGAEPICWTSDGVKDYDIQKGSRSERGTAITLFIDDDSGEFLQAERIREILQRYCAFLPFPIYLEGKQINECDPLWMKPPSECTDKEYLKFYRQVHPMDAEPLFWIHLNVDFPFHLKGILYFPKLHAGFEPKKNGIKLFCNRVFVSDQCSDILPEFLSILRGAIDSPDIPLNVSRSYLQMDRTVRQLGAHIAKKVAEKLTSLHRSDFKKYVAVWPDIEFVVKLGVIQDEKFYDKVKECLIWKNSQGEWTTLQQYIERHAAEYDNKVFYCLDDNHPSHFLELYKEKGIEVLHTTTLVDTALINTLEQKLDGVKFVRIDGAIDEAIIDSSKEKSLLDANGKTEGAKMADFVRSALKSEQVEIEAKSLASDTLAGFILMPEQTRRMRDYFALSQPSMKHMPEFNKHTFVINTNSKTLLAAQKLAQKDPDLASDVVNELYQLSLLAHKELEPAQMNQFVAQTQKILEKLTHSACQS